MTIYDSLINQLLDIPSDIAIIWLFVKFGFIIAFGLYFLFAIIVVRQITMMTKTITTPAEPVLKLFAYVHLIFALIVLLGSIFYL